MSFAVSESRVGRRGSVHGSESEIDDGQREGCGDRRRGRKQEKKRQQDSMNRGKAEDHACTESVGKGHWTYIFRKAACSSRCRNSEEPFQESPPCTIDFCQKIRGSWQAARLQG